MTDETPTPRTKSGHRLHHLSSGYVALLDRDGQIVSQRVHGEIHVAFEPDHRRTEIVFIPDSGTGDVELHAHAEVVDWALFNDDDEQLVTKTQLVPKRGTLQLNFGEVLNDLLA